MAQRATPSKYKAVLESANPNRNGRKIKISIFLLIIALILCDFLLPSRPGSADSGRQDAQPTPVSPAEPVASSIQTDYNPGGLSPLYTGCGGITPPAAVNAAYEQQVLDLVNTQRANNGAGPLKRVSVLDGASRYHAVDMLQDDYFQHDSYDRVGGNLQFSCAWSQRISSYYTGWNYLAENIAAGYSSPQSVMDGWMGSPGHRANILNRELWEIGIGYYNGGSWGHYWVQDFGRRNGIYPLIINRDADSTANRSVNIYIYGSFTQMRLKNDSGAFGAWQAFQASFGWNLPCTTTSHTVTAELRTSDGAVYTSSDTINLTGASCPPTLGELPDLLTFMYSKTQDKVSPLWVSLTPANITTSETISWTTSASGSWFTVSPGSGTTPNAIQVTPTGLNGLSEGSYSGSVTVTATSPGNTEGTPKVVNLQLIVINGPIYNNYLSVVGR